MTKPDTKGINHDWSHIVRIMNSQKAVTVTIPKLPKITTSDFQTNT